MRTDLHHPRSLQEEDASTVRPEACGDAENVADPHECELAIYERCWHGFDLETAAHMRPSAN